MNRPSPARPWIIGAAVVALAMAFWITVRLTESRALESLHANAQQYLQLYTTHLEGELAKFEYLPAVLAAQPEIIRLLRDPANPELVDRINRVLQTVNEASGASDTYLMDANGLTIAASNWQNRRTFVGRNFSFRPYFQHAITGGLGRYFALGTTSQQRGYYFAYPVRDRLGTAGVVVVKVGITPVEYQWAVTWGEFLVTDPDGVIFLTTRPAWKYHTLEPLRPEVLDRIRTSRRYTNADLRPLPVIGRRPYLGVAAALLDIDETAAPSPFGDPGGKSVTSGYLMQSLAMPEAGWQVHVLSRLEPVKVQILRATLLLTVVSAMLLTLSLYLLQRRATHRQRERFESAAKQALELNERRIRAIIDGTRAGLVTLDRAGRISSFNPTAESFFGPRARDWVGTPLLSVIDTGDRADIEAYFADPDRDPPPTREVMGQRADGTSFPLELTIDPLPEAGDGQFIATIHDISERKQHEEALQRAHDELEIRVRERTADLTATNVRLTREIAERRATEETLKQTQEELIQAAKLAALGQMSAGINHELNQPLAAIRSYSDNARKLIEKSRSDEARWNLEQIAQLTDRMARIITQLKAFARKSPGHAVAVSLNAALDGALTLLRIDTRGCEIAGVLPPEELFVMADMVLLEQVLVNLLNNALQAMEGCAERRLEIDGASDGKSVTLAIHDTGPGIAKEHLGQVFDPFFTTKETGIGLGLGLSISYRIIEGYGGSLRAVNHPAGGAVFILRLPDAGEVQEQSA